MAAREINDHVHALGVIDWDRQVFDELIPTPDGTTYNAYLVQGGEKTALIDTADPSYEEEFITNIARLGVGCIDYVIINHAEQDHSGSLPILLELFPMATVLATEKGKELICSLLLIPEERVQVVEDGATISLGDRTLEFLHAPWVHWPDTMLTYLREDGILFSCDLFGSHLATSDLYVQDDHAIEQSAKRYFAEIMMPFRHVIGNYIDRVEGLNPTLIAPSHGPIHDNPGRILDIYRHWVSDEVKNMVLIPYISMHGSTQQMVEYLTEALIERGVRVKPFNLASADTGSIAMALVDAATVVIASPTVLFGPHPKIVYAAFLVNMLKPKTRSVGIIGSFGWGGKTVQAITDMLSNLKADMLDPVYIRGQAMEEDMRQLEHLADEILKRHHDYTIV
ncbi:MAG TPA: FprA family A-type flavoprotein [Methanoculleus sp.]|nr:FprA family A-type flavoprotein [Methanoculleus sp.]